MVAEEDIQAFLNFMWNHVEDYEGVISDLNDENAPPDKIGKTFTGQRYASKPLFCDAELFDKVLTQLQESTVI